MTKDQIRIKELELQILYNDHDGCYHDPQCTLATELGKKIYEILDMLKAEADNVDGVSAERR